ncbi:MAG: tetratricopeptide repeat protein, partial [Cyanobacteria bacterium J06560_6]
FIEALDIRKAELGDRHPDTASSLLNLAALYHNTQQHQRALKLIQQALDIYVPVLGADHPSTQNAIGWRETIQQPLQPTHSPKAISHWLRRAWQAIRGSN